MSNKPHDSYWDAIGDYSLPLAIMFSAMVFMLSCNVHIGSTCGEVSLIPQAAFALSVLNFAILAIKHSSKACFGFVLVGLPGSLAIVNIALEAAALLGTGELSVSTAMSIGLAMVVTLPFVLLSGVTAMALLGWMFRRSMALSNIFKSGFSHRFK